MNIINVPVPFSGTEEERLANRRSHQFGGLDGRCFECDHKSWHVGADYPCGGDVPRMDIERERVRVFTRP